MIDAKTTSLKPNQALPFVVHVDLNSCFAIIEQQANRLLRGRPVGVAAYDTPRGMIIASSYEAKAKGIKLGVNVGQARQIDSRFVVLTPDPAKYREAHRRFKELMLEYTPDVVPKSIDEFVLNMQHSPVYRSFLQGGTLQSHNEAMLAIGRDMKKRISERLGEWVTVNVGISTNRFLAKYAAGFGKPDGMTLIDHTNLRERYDNMNLVDLPGINTRFRARLRNAGIYTPLEFLDADLNTLKKQVFKSINGYHWYMRLRGYEADAVEYGRKSIGHQHALSDKTTDMAKLERLLLKLCEKTGRRLRKNDLYASGIHLYLGFASETRDPQVIREHGMLGDDKERRTNIERSSGFAGNTHDVAYGMRSWHHGEKVYHRLYSTQDIYEAAKRLLRQAEIAGRVSIMSVHVFDLQPWHPEQLTIFDELSRQDGVKLERHHFSSVTAGKRISDAVDAVNNRYGEFVVTPALMMDMQGTILDRIAFGQVRDV